MISKPFDKQIFADNRRKGDAVCGKEILTFSLPGEIGGAQLEGRHWASFRLGCVNVKSEKGEDA